MKRIILIALLLAGCSSESGPEKFDNPCKPDPEAEECKELQP